MLTRPCFCRFVIPRKQVRLKTRKQTLCLVGRDRQASKFHFLATNTSIRSQERQWIHQRRPNARRNHPQNWSPSQVVPCWFFEIDGRKNMVHDVETSGTGCILDSWRRISTPLSQVP